MSSSDEPQRDLGDGWEAWRNYVVQTLAELSRQVNELRATMTKLEIRFASYEASRSYWRLVAGALSSLVAALLGLLVGRALP